MGVSGAIEVRSACGGQGVFALRPLPAHAGVLCFTGPRVRRAAVLRAASRGGHDDFLQIALDVFIGLSGGPDDVVNHACEPNCWVDYREAVPRLRTRRAIARGEELTFDYGLTQIDFPFRFGCGCGRAECRGEIGNCDEIPAARLAAYRRAGIVPPYVAAWLRVDA